MHLRRRHQPRTRIHAYLLWQKSLDDTSLLLAECEGHTGDYCPEVVAERTKTTEGQTPVQVEQATV